MLKKQKKSLLRRKKLFDFQIPIQFQELVFVNQIPNKSLTKAEYKSKYLTNCHDISIDFVIKQIQRKKKYKIN